MKHKEPKYRKTWHQPMSNFKKLKEFKVGDTVVIDIPSSSYHLETGKVYSVHSTFSDAIYTIDGVFKGSKVKFTANFYGKALVLKTPHLVENTTDSTLLDWLETPAPM